MRIGLDRSDHVHPAARRGRLRAVTAEPSPAREAASAAAVELVEPGMTLGLGSGRAVWRVVERLGERFGAGGAAARGRGF